MAGETPNISASLTNVLLININRAAWQQIAAACQQKEPYVLPLDDPSRMGDSPLSMFAPNYTIQNPGVGRGLKGHQVQPPAQGKSPNQSRSDRGWSDFLLDTSSVGALTASQSHGFPCRTALTVKKFFLIFCRKLASCNLSPLLHVMHSGIFENRSCLYSE